MPFTLWSNGRLVGNTELEFRESSPGVRCGWFHPTEEGAQIVDIITSPNRVLLHAAQRGEKPNLHELETAGQNVEGLALELRGEDGAVIKTEDIGITDTELTMQYGDLRSDVIDIDDDVDEFELLEFSVEVDEDEELEPLPRYQIIVFLEGYEALVKEELASLQI